MIVRDSRDHVAGNCHTKVHKMSGVLQHVYGPHISHHSTPWLHEYYSKFADLLPYEHRVKTVFDGNVYSMPINMHTICQLYGEYMTVNEARRAVANDIVDICAPSNLEEHALSSIGRRLYEAFFEGYTAKQWGRHPRDLPASVIKRLPVRFTFDDRYFSDTYQFVPKDGYTAMIEKILDHDDVLVRLNDAVSPEEREDCDLLVWTGPIDGYFDHVLGRLEYRTIDFDTRWLDRSDFQGAAVVNYAESDVPFTRITEHAHLTPRDMARDGTIITYEHSRLAQPDDIPYYPVRLSASHGLIEDYEHLAEAERERGVVFAGRLGRYQYLDMAPAVIDAIDLSKRLIEEMKD